METCLGRYYYLFILYTTWLVPRWDRTTKITVLLVYKRFLYGWPDVGVGCKNDLPQMLFGRFGFVFCRVFVDFYSHRGRLEGLRPNQIVLMPMTWLPRDPILRFVFRFKLALKGGVWYHYFCFYMGSPSMRFIKCCRWPKMICKLFAHLRRTSSFYYYVSSVNRIFFLLGRKYIIWILHILRVWSFTSDGGDYVMGCREFEPLPRNHLFRPLHQRRLPSLPTFRWLSS